MTAQVADSLLWNGIEHDIVAIDDVWPFSPRAHGFEPVSPYTACWRGYVAHYAIVEGRLVLRQLDIGLGEAIAGAWLGIHPYRGDSDEMSEYRNVQLSVAYSGRMVIGTGVMAGFYIHLGFQPAYAYERVFEIALVDGHLESVEDRSPAMARIRSVIEQTGGSPSGVIANLMSRAFSGSYDDCF
jgi:hypothetical protein